MVPEIRQKFKKYQNVKKGQFFLNKNHGVATCAGELPTKRFFQLSPKPQDRTN